MAGKQYRIYLMADIAKKNSGPGVNKAREMGPGQVATNSGTLWIWLSEVCSPTQRGAFFRKKNFFFILFILNFFVPL